jgi:hypothetical protein
MHKLSEFKVGMCVGFKSDYEQYGEIVKIEGEWLHLHNPSGFGGAYLRYTTNTKEHFSDCWLTNH